MFFPLSFQLSNQVRLYAKLLYVGRRKVGQELTNDKVVPNVYYHPRERDRVRRARDLMTLGESVRHVPVGVVILSFSFLLFHIKKEGSHFIKETF